MWENVDSWLVHANQVFRIAQPNFSTDLLKEVGTSFFFPVFKTVNEKIKFLTRWYCFNRYNLSIQNEIIIKNLFIYTALAKHRWVTKLEGFNRKSWKPQKIIIAVRKLFNRYVHSWEDFLREFACCFICSFVIQLISEKKLWNKGFSSNLIDTFA